MINSIFIHYLTNPPPTLPLAYLRVPSFFQTSQQSANDRWAVLSLTNGSRKISSDVAEIAWCNFIRIRFVPPRQQFLFPGGGQRKKQPSHASQMVVAPARSERPFDFPLHSQPFVSASLSNGPSGPGLFLRFFFPMDRGRSSMDIFYLLFLASL